ncbi:MULTISPECIES: MOSC domain-containing protein [Streptomycetaceae]|uniref:MOSC domain-containing protein n=1 Tax=Streptantibioticus cattleyicolor (strain ATCC 35852 / DSM 46488 / JCM 4925 / NBRC 14057 / NRRL 8057) TaxID=1003195 RepID=F8JV57_STREN|nr:MULTISPECIES: MOSC N-terminal beta barrel domain-containing protein [Streptomycetaceae]AEW93140.1 hypothetical protein SCATT_07690 [Streptantibioticus cattleyicolor NRRL 8057 = DSM 46488]MYS57868.1 MOSC domain-containing protein [Streptomyces sp. SID5468]CCB73499.1 conserved protein of unknown function [Streptantibioticus cattleyicolor NRRL 8057 = DSM 46488]
MATVIELIYYPVKGCAGTSVHGARLTPAGIAHDRSFMVVGADGVARTQRRDPLLATVRPEITTDGAHLTLRAPGIDAVTLAVDTEGPRRGVELFGEPYQGIDQGDTVAGWLSQVLGAESRLVRVPPEHARPTDGLTPGTCGYADSNALLVASTASLELLNERITARGAKPLPMSRFRANIVLAGWDEPHTEDRARRVLAGGAELGYAKPAIRCAVTLVDQETGARRGPEPLRSLADYRRAAGGGVAFGAKFSVVRHGDLAVGDEVTVASWGASEV